MSKEHCALKLVDEVILYYDTRSKKTSKEIIVTICSNKIRDKVLLRLQRPCPAIIADTNLSIDKL